MPNSENRERPIVDYSGSTHKRYSPFAIVAAFSAIAFLILILLSILAPSSNRGGSSPRVKCASNLRQIGQAILMYANEHQGAYPDSLATVLLNEDITAGVFVCPSTNDEAASGPTTQAIASNLTAGGHLSYIYVGRGWTSSTVSADAVVAYEPLSNHGGDGMEVLFGDGHVDWVDAKHAAKILASAGDGKPPVIMGGE